MAAAVIIIFITFLLPVDLQLETLEAFPLLLLPRELLLFLVIFLLCLYVMEDLVKLRMCLYNEIV